MVAYWVRALHLPIHPPTLADSPYQEILLGRLEVVSLVVDLLTETQLRHRALAVVLVEGLIPMPPLPLVVALIKAALGVALGAVLTLAMQLNLEALAVLRLVKVAEVAQGLQHKALLELLELLVDLVAVAADGVTLRRLVLVVRVV